MTREDTERRLAEIKQPHVITFFPAIKIIATPDGRCCEFCQAQHGRRIPTEKCTAKMLPPFHGCTNGEDGCRCTFTTVDKWDAQKGK